MPEFECFGRQNSTCNCRSPNSSLETRSTVLPSGPLTKIPCPWERTSMSGAPGAMVTALATVQLPSGGFQAERSLPLNNSAALAGVAEFEKNELNSRRSAQG